MKFHTRYNYCKIFTVFFPLWLLAGCSVHSQKLQHHDSAVSVPVVTPGSNVQTVAADEYARNPQVIRYDRYLLLSTDPLDVQRDPLSQIIQIRIPSALNPTVADALHYILRQSGYSLCTAGTGNSVLYRQSLPAVQYRLGPVPLRTALQIIAGSAWQLEIDDVQRVVCHSLRDGYQLPAQSEKGIMKK